MKVHNYGKPLVSDAEMKRHCAIFQPIPPDRFDLMPKSGGKISRPQRAVDMFANLPDGISTQQKQKMLEDYATRLNNKTSHKLKPPQFNTFDPDKPYMHQQHPAEQINQQILQRELANADGQLNEANDIVASQQLNLDEHDENNVSLVQNHFHSGLQNNAKKEHIARIITHLRTLNLNDAHYQGEIERISRINTNRMTSGELLNVFNALIDINPEFVVNNSVRQFTIQSSQAGPSTSQAGPSTPVGPSTPAGLSTPFTPPSVPSSVGKQKLTSTILSLIKASISPRAKVGDSGEVTFYPEM